jgi:hypothetical protein
MCSTTPPTCSVNGFWSDSCFHCDRIYDIHIPFQAYRCWVVWGRRWYVIVLPLFMSLLSYSESQRHPGRVFVLTAP